MSKENQVIYPFRFVRETFLRLYSQQNLSLRSRRKLYATVITIRHPYILSPCLYSLSELVEYWRQHR